MAIDYAEREREFLAGLEADTGHDLAGWMVLIEAQKLAHRNDIIDWLRTKGFHFSWASWLERIHHNGGKPIYAAAASVAGGLTGAGPSPAAPLPAARPGPAASERPRPVLVPAASAAPARPPPTPPPSNLPAVPAGGTGGTDLAAILAGAKAYRMLADHLIREVRKALPDVVVAGRDGYVSFAHPLEFAALAVSPRELRLGLELGDDAGQGVVPRGRMTGTAATVTHVGVLTDARQVNATLIEAVRQADRRVNR